MSRDVYDALGKSGELLLIHLRVLEVLADLDDPANPKLREETLVAAAASLKEFRELGDAATWIERARSLLPGLPSSDRLELEKLLDEE